MPATAVAITINSRSSIVESPPPKIPFFWHPSAYDHEVGARGKRSIEAHRPAKPQTRALHVVEGVRRTQHYFAVGFLRK
jgi:hypothetical protein